jgi:outer membrane protein assembly factor BamB
MPRFRHLVLLLLFFLLTACAGLGDDNTPSPTALTSYPFQFQPVPLWSMVTGGGMDKDFLRLGPVIKDGQVFVSNKSGLVTAVTLSNGHKLWQAKLKQPISSSPAVGEGAVVFASMQPQLIALEAESGDLLWQTALPNQVLASPVIHQGHVIVKTVDGKVLAFALKTGRPLWSYNHAAPTLVLRVSSMPRIIGNKVLIGFSDGTLTALNLNDGRLLWERTIAYPQGVTQADQLVDIAADPRLDNQTIYIATYQGKLSAISLQTGQIQWQRPFSSYSGLALGKNLYVTDSKGGVWAFDRSTGQVLWHNRLLRNRGLTAPVIMGNSLVLGDKEGYLHWLAQVDGHPLARVLVHDSASIAAAPRVSYPLVCVLTQQGGLSAWTQSALHI